MEGCAGTGLHTHVPDTTRQAALEKRGLSPARGEEVLAAAAPPKQPSSGVSGGSLVPAAGSSASARRLHGPRWLTMLEAFSRGCRDCSQQPRACRCPLPCSQVLGPPCSASPPHPLHALLSPPGAGSLLHTGACREALATFIFFFSILIHFLPIFSIFIVHLGTAHGYPEWREKRAGSKTGQKLDVGAATTCLLLRASWSHTKPIPRSFQLNKALIISLGYFQVSTIGGGAPSVAVHTHRGCHSGFSRITQKKIGTGSMMGNRPRALSDCWCFISSPRSAVSISLLLLEKAAMPQPSSVRPGRQERGGETRT